jgi:hypothetical protein
LNGSWVFHMGIGRDRVLGTTQRRATKKRKEKMDMMPAHKWEAMEKEGKGGKSDPNGQIIKGSRMARNRWTCQDKSNSTVF